VRLRSLTPGECAEIYVRFRRRPPGEKAVLRVNLENGRPLEVTIPYKDPGVMIDYVATDRSMRTLYVYARRKAGGEVGSMNGLQLDGQVPTEVSVHGADFSTGVALAVARLPARLELGAYHTVGISTDVGRMVAAQFRVLPFLFVRNSVGTPAEWLAEMHMNVAGWGELSREECERYGVGTMTLWNRVFGLHPRVMFALGRDEPDASFDPKEDRGPGGLGRCARLAVEQNGWNELLRRLAPKVATWASLDSTYTPLNWAVYGQ